MKVGKTWDKVILLHNAVSDTRDQMTVKQHHNNQGDTRILAYNTRSPSNNTFSLTVTSILLDDLLEVIPFNKSIIKIDIQGYEHKAFQEETAGKLLSKIHVPVIFFEWVLMGKLLLDKNTPVHDREQIYSMLRFFKNRNYKPYTILRQGGKDISSIKPEMWPPDIIWRLSN